MLISLYGFESLYPSVKVEFFLPEQTAPLFTWPAANNIPTIGDFITDHDGVTVWRVKARAWSRTETLVGVLMEPHDMSSE